MATKLCFFFEWGFGCLWAGDADAAARFGYGPLDMGSTGVNGEPGELPRITLSAETLILRDQLCDDTVEFLNPRYPPDPSLWRQSRCDRFNADIDRLLDLVKNELEPEFVIVDEQRRDSEDPRLNAYLMDNKDLDAIS